MDKAIQRIDERVRRKVITPRDNTIFNGDRGVKSVGGQNTIQQGQLNTNRANRVLTFAFPASAILPLDE
jgi:hypothetical protein